MSFTQGGTAKVGSLITTLLQRGYRGPLQWWRDATIYDMAITELPDPGLESTYASIMQAARLGFQAVRFRPSHIDPCVEEDAALVKRVIDRAHQVGLRAIVQVSGANRPAPASPEQGPIPTPIRRKEVDGLPLVDRAAAFLELGADGIDLGLIVEPELTGAEGEAGLLTEVVHKLESLVSLQGEETTVGATASAQFPDSYVRHLNEDWMHHLRDDRLQLSPWTAAGLRDAITTTAAERTKLGHTNAWLPNVRFALGAFAPLQLSAWFNEPEHIARRAQAINLLALMLPGAVYIQQGDEVAYTHFEELATAQDTLDAIAALLVEQRRQASSPYTVMRTALRVRAERRLGTGPLAVVEGASWQTERCLALQNRDVMAVTNLGMEPLEVPHAWQVLVSSVPCEETAGSVVIPPQATTWLRICN
ncbi:MAG: hypothetical protein Q3999_07565 [Buchananella hordeovulneris]|nr:hypothetical protein [Buchananella hordeovulneris]